MGEIGLTTEEARERLAKFGANELPTESKKSLFSISFEVIREPMLLLLIFAGAISFALAELLDGILLVSTVFIVLGISIFQSRRTENALQALKELTTPLGLVVRDGIEIRIASSQVVPDDLIVILEGDRVIADAKLVSASSLEFDESLLTGESVPVTKGIGDTIFAGSLIVRGHGRARVIATGTNSQLGRIGKSLQEISEEKTHLQQNIERIVKVIGIAAFVTVAIVIINFGLTRGNWLQGALSGIAVAMALIPEEFPVILTLFMVLGAWRMTKVRVIARKPAAIEALGSITVLCVDKTGTLTRNEMEVVELKTGSSRVWRKSETIDSEIQKLIDVGALATPITAFDPMDRAFKSLSKVDFETFKSISEISLQKDRLIYTHIWKEKDAEGDNALYASKGAPEHVAKLCGLAGEDLISFENSVEEAAARGLRVIAIAEGTSETNWNYLGLALLQDPIREGIPSAVSQCTRAGIRTLMITGDHPKTALSVAKQIGLPSEMFITGTEFKNRSDAELISIIKNCSVFARFTPEDKLRLVNLLKSQGEIVGMTGDGVNDAPALRAADVGIAMGARGTDVAREAAALIITDDNYTSIVAGIFRGRAIFSNIQKAMSYVIAIHFPIFGMAFLPVFNTSWPIVLLPALVAFHEIIIDPASSIVFEVEEPDPGTMNQPPRDPKKPLIGLTEFSLAALQGFSIFASVFLTYLYSLQTGASEERIRSLTFSALIISNVILILANRSKTLTILAAFRARKNKAIPWIVLLASVILVLIFNIGWLRDALRLESITLRDYLFLILLSYLSICWLDFYKFLKSDRTIDGLTHS